MSTTVPPSSPPPPSTDPSSEDLPRGSHRATGRAASSVLPNQRGDAPAATGLLALPGMLEEDHRPRKVRLLSMLALSVVGGLLLAILCLPLVGGMGLGAKSTADTFNDLPAELFAPPLPERSVILDRNGAPIAYAARRPGPRERAVRAHPRPDAAGDRGHRGPPLLRAPRHRLQGRPARRGQQPGERRGHAGWFDPDPAVREERSHHARQHGRRAARRRRNARIKRKLREARYALALEKKLSKDQILTNYLNIAYFGDGAYGVAAASQHYFGKDISTVNAVEAALLAGLVQNPNVYNPKLHPDGREAAARPRPDRDGRVRLPHASRASGTPPRVPVRVRKGATVSDGCEAAGSAAFFCQYLRSTLLNDPAFGPTPEERQRKLFEGGLQIRTSLDPAVQAAAQSAADQIVPSGNRVATAVVVLQPGTGEVQAMAVNRIYAPTADGKPVQTTADRVHTKLNYAVLPFQAGSTYKLFTLAAALEQGLPLSTTYNAPNCYRSQIFSNPDGNCFHNASDGEGGVFSMTQATAHSVNTYFVQLEERVGRPQGPGHGQAARRDVAAARQGRGRGRLVHPRVHRDDAAGHGDRLRDDRGARSAVHPEAGDRDGRARASSPPTPGRAVSASRCWTRRSPTRSPTCSRT